MHSNDCLIGRLLHLFRETISSTLMRASADILYSSILCSGKCFFILFTAFKRLLDEDDPSNYLDIPNLYTLFSLLSSLDILVSIELQVVLCW